MRKLIAMVVALLAMAGVLASQASAAVEVRNSGGELCGVEAVCEVSIGSGSWAKFEWTGGGPRQGYFQRCAAEFTFQVVSETGEIVMLDADFAPENPFLWQFCRSTENGPDLNDCDDAGWSGQIVATGSGFEAVFDSCWVTRVLDYYPALAETRFGIEQVSTPEPHQRWTLDAQAYGPNVTLTGGLALPSEELQIAEVE